MAVKINNDCTNCGACEPECPNSAIYELGQNWKYADGTILSGEVSKLNGEIINADDEHQPLSEDFYYVVEDKCTECVSYSKEPQCIAVCPMEAFDISIEETTLELIEKIEWLKGKEMPYESCPVHQLFPTQNNVCSHHTREPIIEDTFFEKTINKITQCFFPIKH